MSAIAFEWGGIGDIDYTSAKSRPVPTKVLYATYRGRRHSKQPVTERHALPLAAGDRA